MSAEAQEPSSEPVQTLSGTTGYEDQAWPSNEPISWPKNITAEGTDAVTAKGN